MMDPVQSWQSPALPPELAATSPAAARGQKAAREFEAQLIGNLLEEMQKTFTALPGDDVPAGSEDYNYLGTQALAGALADRGGFGIARLISRYLAAHEGK
jgi:Rod binding domain-containing protein